MPKILITPVFNFETPEGPSDQFKAITTDMDAQSWRGRGSVWELPESAPHGGPHGAGGNADASGDPADRLPHATGGSFRIAGPADVTGKGSTAIGGKGRK